MSKGLPRTAASWRKQAQDTVAPLDGLLEAATLDFQSGSNFTLKEFLHLRILHRGNLGIKLRLSNPDVMPSHTIDEVVKLLNNNPSFKMLQPTVSPSNFKTWSCKEAVATGNFAIGLELLHSVIEKQAKESPSDEATTKITPRKARHRVAQDPTEDLRHGVSVLNFNPQTPKPKRVGFEDFEQVDASTIEDSPMTIASVDSLKDDEMRKIREKYEKEMFEVIDEQTVNSCLVALIMPLTWILGLHLRVHLDRRAFRVQDSGQGNYLYEARVDGIIVDGKGVVKAFMEVKRDIRAERLDVRMQESAQMAALIHSDKNPLPKGKQRYRVGRKLL